MKKWHPIETVIPFRMVILRRNSGPPYIGGFFELPVEEPISLRSLHVAIGSLTMQLASAADDRIGMPDEWMTLDGADND